jgi:hypothetical protein
MNQPHVFGGRLQRKTFGVDRPQAVHCSEAPATSQRRLSQPCVPERHRKANGPWIGDG